MTYNKTSITWRRSVALLLALAVSGASAADYYQYNWRPNTYSSTDAFRTDTTQTAVTVPGPVSGDNNIYIDSDYFGDQGSYKWTELYLNKDVSVSNLYFDIKSGKGTMSYFHRDSTNATTTSMTVTGNVDIQGACENGMGFRDISLDVKGNINIGNSDRSTIAVFGGLTFDTGSNQMTMRGLTVGGNIIATKASINLGVAEYTTRTGTATIGGKFLLDEESIINTSADLYADITMNVVSKGIVGGKYIRTIRYRDTGCYSYTTFTFNNTDRAVSNAAIGLGDKNTIAYIDLSMEGSAKGIQEFTNTANVIGDIAVKSGTLWVAGTAQAVTVSGGKFGAGLSDGIGSAALASLDWEGGNLEVNVFQIENTAFAVTNALTVSNFESLAIDFANFGEIVEGTEYRLITFGSTNMTQSDLDKISCNILGYKVDLTLNSTSVGATFTAVPEPAFYASLLGLAALAVAVRRRK